MRLGQVRPGALLRSDEVAGPELDVGLAREPLGHGRVVMEVEAHDDFALLRHWCLLPHRIRGAITVARTAMAPWRFSGWPSRSGLRRWPRPRPPPAHLHLASALSEASGPGYLKGLTFRENGRESGFSIREIRMIGPLQQQPEVPDAAPGNGPRGAGA